MKTGIYKHKKTIKHKKGKLDAKRAKIFTKIGREIMVAVKLGGPDPDGNSRLKLVMQKAKGSSIILHSLPRRDELLPEVDDSRHARYWQEAYNGVVMRMALLSSVLGVWE